MPGRRRPALAVEAERRTREQLARLGREVRDARSRHRLSQQQVGERAGVGRMTISRIERGHGGGVTLEAWQRVGLAVGRPITMNLQRDLDGETADAGHLALQELVLRVTRSAGFETSVELPTRPAEPWRSADVALMAKAPRLIIVVECWNTIGDVGAAIRASERKVADARDLAVARWGHEASAPRLVWVVRATARNRALIARYPEMFARRFPGSSAAWVATLAHGTPPPLEPGLVWADAAASRLLAWRRPR